MDQYWGVINNSSSQFLYHNYLNWGTTNNNGTLQSVTECLGGTTTNTSFPHNFSQT